MKTGIAILALLALTQAAKAENGRFYGRELLDVCTNDKDVAVNLYCMGFVRGTVDAVMNDCLANRGISVKQMAHVTSKYLQEHPEIQHLDASYVVRVALYQAFNCTGNAYPDLAPGGEPVTVKGAGQ
jgi:hypothetical protein